MKIVCGACGAKYSIADEKVQGKVFKIRCKKCSNVIVVKGNDDAGGDETVSESVGAAEWYVVVDGDQVGPISKVEIDSYYTSGRINAESFAWKDGLPDWLPLSALDDFQHLTHGDAAGPEETTQISDNYSHYQSQVNSEEADSTGIMPSASSYGDDAGGYGYDAGFSAFGGESEAASGYEASPSFDSASSFTGFDSSSDSGGAGGGMFASFDSPSPSSSGAKDNDDFLGFTSPDPVPVLGSSLSSGGGGTNGSSAMVNDDMVGKRNENSVLFSLSSLDQVQAVSGKASSDAVGDVPLTDGSGLIDIRALASAHKSMKSGADHGPSVDPFTTGTMAMPALMPMGSHRSNKPMIIGGVVAAIVLFAFGGILIYLLATRDNTPQTQVITEQVIVREIVAQPADDARAAADAKAAEEAAKAAMEEPSSDSADEKTTASSKTATKKGTTTTKATKSDEPAQERTVATAAPAKKKGDNIDNLLAQLDSSEEPTTKTKSTKTTKTAAPSTGGGKAELSRDDVQNVIRANSGRINTCYRSQNSGSLSGTMRVKFMIKPNGSIGNTEILTGSFAGTDVGSCVQKAVAGMRFPATTASADVPITYPFKLE